MKNLRIELREIGVNNIASLFLVTIVLLLIQVVLEVALGVAVNIRTLVANVPQVFLGMALYHYLFRPLDNKSENEHKPKNPTKEEL